ncbi:MAG TPA: vitamin K epoxide reductase family protein [Anaerolineales bacterium]|nr:vitamin K epoxide reductase family protein [Anaerolineales bacterium]
MNKWLYRISVGLAALGLAVSCYMTVFKLTNNDKMCLGSGDCATVNASVYSEVNGVPVAVIGAGGYLTILVLLLMEPRNAFLKKNGTLVVFGLALMGFLFTLYLIYVEVALIRAYCPFCITSQITMTLLFILSVTRLVRQPIN